MAKIIAHDEINEYADFVRYMSFYKFIHLISTSSLYFCKAKHFNDKMEGRMPSQLKLFMDSEKAAGRGDFSFDEYYHQCIDNNFVCCWTMQTDESMAMWQLYAHISESVAVRTTFSRLLNSLAINDDYEEYYVFQVKYVGHKDVLSYVIGNPRELLQYKLSGYKYEKEVRILLTDSSGEEKKGIVVQIGDINEFITGLIVPPDASQGFVDMVKSVCSKYGISAPIYTSELSYR